jgi:hypothetical protein
VPASIPVVLSAAVEGEVDEHVLRRVVEQAEARVGQIYGKCGWDGLRDRIEKYNAAARHGPWIVLVDLDRKFPCAPALVANWLPQRSPHLVLRVAVQSVEAWLLADRERVARFFDVSASSIPDRPDAVPDPKQAVVDLARRSRRREVRSDMVPRPGSGRRVGAACTSRIVEFIQNAWRPDVAARPSPSLKGLQEALASLIGNLRGPRA